MAPAEHENADFEASHLLGEFASRSCDRGFSSIAGAKRRHVYAQIPLIFRSDFIGQKKCFYISMTAGTPSKVAVELGKETVCPGIVSF